MSIQVYKSKAEWLEKVMASDLTPATKVFAWAVFNRAYGDKIESHPGKSTIQEDSHINPSKYKDYRDALVGCGALTAVALQSPTGEWDNYRYTLNLEWGGGTHRGTGCTPQGTGVSPTGSQGVPHRDTGVYPTGSSNTSIQSPNESFKGDLKEDASVADAPEAANLESHEPQNTSDSDTSHGISEPLSSYTSEFENDSSSEPTINEGDLGEPAEPARPAEPANISRGQLKAAAEMLGVRTIDLQRRNFYAIPKNRDVIVLRAGKPEFQHLPTAEARCEAALDAILEGQRA